MIDAALSYIARGFSIIPMHWLSSPGMCSCGERTCRGVAKHPLAGRGWVDSPDMTAAEAVAKWQHHPRACVGLRLGRGHVAVQVYDIAQEKNDYPKTLTWRHEASTVYIFEGDDRGRRVRQGVEFRARGGLVVAPPSAITEMILDIDPTPVPGFWSL